MILSRSFCRWTGVVMLIALFAACFSTPAQANRKYASIVMDADTGMILHQRHANKMLHPASLTKIMTLVMVFDAIDRGQLRLNDKIYVSRHAASMVPSKIGLKPGSYIRVKDAILALVTKSANDIAVAIAEKIGGTESRFAVLMTRRAREIGMTRTRFMNASGLHHPKQVSTARDMARLALYVLNNQRRHYRYFSTQRFNYRGQSYRNHNRLLESYNGLDGIKTGYIQAAGFNLVASAERNGRRIIGVVFGGRSSKTRNAHMKDLLDRGFRKLPDIRVAKAPPLPTPKPDRGVMQLTSRAADSAGQIAEHQWAQLKTNLTEGMIAEMAGEGDIDPNALRRFEVGLMAASVHTGERYSKQRVLGDIIKNPVIQNAAAIAPAAGTAAPKPAARAPAAQGIWSIQIGAFGDRDATHKTLNASRTRLPSYLKSASPFIAPLKTDSGWVYRAWLTGYNETQARAACGYFKDCMVIQPLTQQRVAAAR